MLGKAPLFMVAAATTASAFQQLQRNDIPDLTNLGIIDEIGTAPCVFKLNSNFYDFTPIKVKFPDPIFPYLDGKPTDNPHDLQKPSYWFVFGWCQHIDESHEQKYCLEDYFAGRIDGPEPDADAECTQYSGKDAFSDIKTKEIEAVPQTVKHLRQGSGETRKGVMLKYENGPKCESDPSRKKSLTLNLYCDNDMDWDEYDLSSGVLGDLCEPYIDSISKVACSQLSTSELWDYVEEYKYYFGALLLVAGLALTFFGLKLLKPAVCVAGFLSTIFISCFIFYGVYVDQESDLGDFWWFLGGGALVGIFVGLLMAWCTKLGAAILGGWGGATVGLILYSAFIYKAKQDWLLWVTVAVFAIAAAVFAFFIMEEVVIVASTLLGAYMLVRGTACYAGHYVNEATMASLAKEGLLDTVDKWYWAYFAGFFIMVGLGIWVQFSSYIAKKREEERKKKHPYLLNQEANGQGEPYQYAETYDANRVE